MNEFFLKKLKKILRMKIEEKNNKKMFLCNKIHDCFPCKQVLQSYYLFVQGTHFNKYQNLVFFFFNFDARIQKKFFSINYSKLRSDGLS